MSDKKKKSIWSKTLLALSMLLVLAVIFIPIIDKNFKSTLKPELKNFALEDPEEVTEIFMATKNSTTSFVKLSLNDKGVWMVNDEFPAEPEKIKMLLNEYLARLIVKNPIPNGGIDNVVKSMASNAIKVEIYKGTHKDKVIYVGGNSADEMGTHMMLENSSRPFVVHIPGFMGYPSAIFNMNPKKWKSLNIFQAIIVDLKSVSVFYPADAGGSFTIHKEERTLRLEPYIVGDLKDPKALDMALLKQYAATFESLNYESIYEGLAAQLADSVIRVDQPYAVINLDRVDGTDHELKIYKKPVTADSPQLDNFGNPVNYDLDRFYGVLDGNTSDILSVQSFVFKNIFKKYGAFYGEKY